MTTPPSHRGARDDADKGYIPSPPAAFVGVFLSIGIVVLALRDSFTLDYDARATIVIMSVLIGGVFGFDYRRGRWKGEAPPPGRTPMLDVPQDPSQQPPTPPAVDPGVTPEPPPELTGPGGGAA